MAGSLLAIAIAACSGAASPAPSPTAAPQVGLKTVAAPPQACMEALIGGMLTKNPVSGLGITSTDGQSTAVEWPFRYGAREVLGRIVLIDETGTVVAREGDQITVGGGFGNQFWHACGPVTVTRPAS